MNIKLSDPNNLTLLKCVVAILDGKEMSFTYEHGKRLIGEELVTLIKGIVTDYEDLEAKNETLEKEKVLLMKGVNDAAYLIANEDTTDAGVIKNIHQHLIDTYRGKNNVH